MLAHGAAFDRVYAHAPASPTVLSLVRMFKERASEVSRARELNELFDSYLTHYWRLRVKLRVFGPISEHLLDLHVAPYLIGDGILSKKRS